MTAIETMILAPFDFAVFIVIITTILSKKFNVKRILIFMTATIIMTVTINGMFTNEIVIHILSTVMSVLWFKFYIGKRDWNTVLFLYVITIIISYVFVIIATLAVSLVTPNFEFTFKYGLISQIITLIITIIACRFIPFRHLYSYIQRKNGLFKIIVVNVYLLYFFFSIVWFADTDSIINSKLGVIIILMLTVVINTIFLREGFANQASEDQLRIYENYLPIVDALMNDIKSKQHDYHNHIQALLSMRANKQLYDSEEFDAYTKELMEDDLLEDLIRFDNRMIMALLYSKYSIAKEKSIDITFKVHHNVDSVVHKDTELVEMYGILLDNAIEATESLTEKKIHVEVSKDGDLTTFSIYNSAEYIAQGDVSKMFTYGVTEKSDGHKGIGLYKVKSMLAKKKGTITASYDTEKSLMTFELNHY